MDSRQFEARVETAIQGLPHEFRERLDNVVVVVEDWPSQEQLGSVGLSDPMELLGRYEALPLTYRSRDHAGRPQTAGRAIQSAGAPAPAPLRG